MISKFKYRESSIPVLAYHEVHEEPEREKKIRTMGPSCSIHKKYFCQQVLSIKQNNYETVMFSDLTRTNIDLKRKIIITFDDGHIGNYLYAYPLLLKYGLRAVFFITINFIGKINMMDWQQLREMCSSRMSIQSHCVNHEPLETLSKKCLVQELSVSKQIIEDKVGVEVNTLSLPHGSIHNKIKEIANKVGYQFICTSKIDYYHPAFNNHDVAFVPRIPIEDTLSNNEFNKILFQRSRMVARRKNNQKVKSMIRKMIGINNYRKIYRLIHNINLGTTTME